MRPMRRLASIPGMLLEAVAARLEGSGARHCAYGTALWAAAELTVPAPRAAVDGVRARTSDLATLRGFRAQDLGMLLSGVSGQARTNASWSGSAHRIREAILTGLSTPTGLFRDRATGPRRFLATFATQVYCVLGLYHYGAVFDDPEAAAAADACVARLLTLQGPQGEWPWFYNVSTGRVVDYYEVYSVHQHGMAPAILKPAAARGVPGAREALSKGFNWIFGQNRLSTSMLRPDLGVVARSQARREIGDGRIVRIARTAFDHLTARPARIDLRPERLMIRPEVRSYELGWILWSFGNDTKFYELTHHQDFDRPERDTAPLAADRKHLRPHPAPAGDLSCGTAINPATRPKRRSRPRRDILLSDFIHPKCMPRLTRPPVS